MTFEFAENRFAVDVMCEINELDKPSCMELCIEKGKPIRDVQKEFNELYPFLKIELIEKGQPAAKVVSGINFTGNCKHVDVSGTRTVAELEGDFRNFFNLPIQVFRKAGSLWIETSLTHDWSLEQQNREGELFSNIHATLNKK
jgi:hypothetical protein